MGSWTETCAITNQPLTGPAYCVVIPREACFNIRMMRIHDVHIAKGLLDCYGTMYDITEKTGNVKFSVERYHNTDEKIRVIFVSKHAWESVIERIKSKGIEYNDYETLVEDYDYFYKGKGVSFKLHKLHFEWYLIERFLYHIRRSFINNNEFSGSQHEAYDDLIFANSLIQVPEKED